MRIHLGHHFYGAGNLGDDFMLAGFLAAMRGLVPTASYTAAVPFPLEPLRDRFPLIDWRPYTPDERENCIARCDAWLGLGGSPFQSAQSRWFLDHLVSDAQLCRQHDRRMFFLGIGVQTASELTVPDAAALCEQAAAIWTRDSRSAERIQKNVADPTRVKLGSDLAHILFRSAPPPAATAGRMTAVANFDFAHWGGQSAFLRAADTLDLKERIWLAQESRDLPGAEKALHATLTPRDRAKWRLVDPGEPHSSLADALARWPSGEWAVCARHHAAIAAAWAGSKIVVITTNAKLEAIASDLNVPAVSPHASVEEWGAAFDRAMPTAPPIHSAELADTACAEFWHALVSR